MAELNGTVKKANDLAEKQQTIANDKKTFKETNYSSGAEVLQSGGYPDEPSLDEISARVLKKTRSGNGRPSHREFNLFIDSQMKEMLEIFKPMDGIAKFSLNSQLGCLLEFTFKEFKLLHFNLNRSTKLKEKIERERKEKIERERKLYEESIIRKKINEEK